MSKDITPQANPAMPTTLNVPAPGDQIKAGLLEALFQGLLNGLWFLRSYVDTRFNNLPASSTDAQTLQGTAGAGFWKKTEAVAASSLGGFLPAEFWRKAEAVNATTLQGFTADAFMPKDGGPLWITTQLSGTGNATAVGEYDNFLSLNFPIPAGKTGAKLLYLEMNLRYGPICMPYVIALGGGHIDQAGGISGAKIWDLASAPDLYRALVQNVNNNNAQVPTVQFIVSGTNITNAAQTYSNTRLDVNACIQFY